MAHASAFDTPRSTREADDNIRHAKSCQERLRQRGRLDEAREWDAEIQHQQAERKRITDELDAGIQEIWGV